VADIIPVDYVTNAIISSTAIKANKPGLTIIHSNSSDRNPVTWQEYLDKGFAFIEKQPIP
jgi:hypothetical protein